MDSAHPRPPSPLSTSANPPATTRLPVSSPPTLKPRSKRYSEPTTHRQKRLIHNRNVKFPAKKLSLSNIGSKFSQLIHANDEDQEFTTDDAYESTIENKEDAHIGSRGILSEVTNTSRKSKRSEEFSIYQDTPERPLLQRSPFSSPSAYPSQSSELCSPLAFDHIQDSLATMRLRQISGNELRSSPLVSSQLTGSIKAVKRRKSTQIRAGFDTQEYIEHLEKELQQAKDEMFSPNTNRSLKDQLKAARHENDKLRQEFSDMRDMFELEVKRTIEHKTQMEVELKRKVRSLEDELEQKACTIRDLELEHDTRRLDTNTIDTLKAAIERLEQDKLLLTDENRSMNKRNEVLSELLAMSPTKTQPFELRSPVREKRASRPMSMIIPRLPSSPNGRQVSQTSSAVVSPALSTGGPFFRAWRSDPDSPQLSSQGLVINSNEQLDSVQPILTLVEEDLSGDCLPSRVRSRRSTMQSQVSISETASIVSDSSSPADQPSQRQYPKRKPRKFMSGSTQLKPLLLPALTGDSVSLISPSIPSSPKSEALDDMPQDLADLTSCSSFGFVEGHVDESTLLCAEVPVEIPSDTGSNSTSAVYNTIEEILTEDKLRATTDALDSSELYADQPLDSTSSTKVSDNAEAFEAVWDFPSTSGVSDSPGGFDAPSGSTFDAACAETLRHSAPYIGLDLDALNDLNLPEPSFDCIPKTGGSKDDALSTAVPRPLFSLNGPARQSQPQLTHKTLLDQRSSLSQEVSPPLRRRFVRSPPQMNDLFQSPTPQSRYSWHGHTDGSWSAPRSLHVSATTNSGRTELPQRSTLKNAESLARTKGPLDMLRSSKLGAQPLATLTIKTIFGTISQCTRHVRDFKRDPLALARRLIANAWLSNWKIFGRLSWWVLGLFIRSGVGGPKLKQWDWSSYDAEEIARKACRNEHDLRPASTNGRGNSSANPVPVSNHNTPVVAKPKVGWGQSVLLWGKFSVAIMLAIGGAVAKGPGEMLKEIEGPPSVTVPVADLSPEKGVMNEGGRNLNDSPHTTDPGSRGAMTRGSQDQHDSSSTLRGWWSGGPLRHSVSYSVPSFEGFRGGHFMRPPYPVDVDEDATLKPLGSPRMPVAALFQREGVYMSDDLRFKQSRPCMNGLLM